MRVLLLLEGGGVGSGGLREGPSLVGGTLHGLAYVASHPLHIW